MTVAFGVIRTLRPVLAPVRAVTTGPGSLRMNLIGAVVGVALQLAPLPASSAFTLTGRQPAIVLLGNLRTRPECLPACRASPALNGCVSAHKKHRAWATPSVDNSHPEVHRNTDGDKDRRNYVRGSIPLSDRGSIPLIDEAWNLFCVFALICRRPRPHDSFPNLPHRRVIHLCRTKCGET